MSAVMYYLKGLRYEPTVVTLPSKEEQLAAQARKATRFLNSRIIRDLPQPIELVVDTGKSPVAWYYRRRGPGRPRRCSSMTEAMLHMERNGGGRVGPLFV